MLNFVESEFQVNQSDVGSDRSHRIPSGNCQKTSEFLGSCRIRSEFEGKGEGVSIKMNERVQNTNRYFTCPQQVRCVHKRMYPHEYALSSARDLIRKDHKIKVGVEPTSSSIRLVILPLNYLLFSSIIKMITYSKIFC